VVDLKQTWYINKFTAFDLKGVVVSKMENMYDKLKSECINETELFGIYQLFNMMLAIRQQVNLRAKGGDPNRNRFNNKSTT
jgi:hypothetical protein